MAKPFPEEFRRDVVAVARKREPPLFQIEKDFGVSEATLHNWLPHIHLEQDFAMALRTANQLAVAYEGVVFVTESVVTAGLAKSTLSARFSPPVANEKHLRSSSHLSENPARGATR